MKNATLSTPMRDRPMRDRLLVGSRAAEPPLAHERLDGKTRGIECVDAASVSPDRARKHARPPRLCDSTDQPTDALAGYECCRAGFRIK
jgi:hypothetical protein